MNHATPERLMLANRQIDDLIRGLALLRSDVKSQPKYSKIGTLMRLEALELSARSVERTLEQMTRDARSDAFKVGGQHG